MNNILGRRKEINRALQLLRQQNVVEILGIKGVGKTHFLNYLRDYTSKTGKFITLLFDPPFGFNLLDNLLKALNKLLIQQGVNTNRRINLDNLGKTIKSIENKVGKHLIFFFDDAHEYDLNMLRKIILQVNSTESKIVYTSIKPISSNSTKIILNPFERKDSYKFILKMLRNKISKASMLFIHSTCGGIPKYLYIIMLLLKKWSLQKNVMIDENVARNILSYEVRHGLLRSLLLENLRAYVFVYGKEFIEIIENILTNPGVIPRERRLKKIAKDLMNIGLIAKQKDIYHLVDPLLARYLQNYKQGNRNESKKIHFVKIEKQVKRLFSNYTIIENDVRIYEKGLLFQISSSISLSKVVDLLKIKKILNARTCYYICPKVNVEKEISLLMRKNKVVLIMHETKNYSELLENAFREIKSILLKADSNSQQNL